MNSASNNRKEIKEEIELKNLEDNIFNDEEQIEPTEKFFYNPQIEDIKKNTLKKFWKEYLFCK